MSCARDAVADFWDGMVQAALAGGAPHRDVDVLRRWFDGYRGSGRGVVNTEASPEPYIGPLATRHGTPRLVALGLNPGRADLRFQGVGGVFAQEHERLGGFSSWAVSEPYLRPPWRTAYPRNRYHENLRLFARRWLRDPSVRSRDVLVFELYPWHSDMTTAVMAPEVEIVDEFIWRPISELEVEEVIAIGAPWRRIAQNLGLRERSLEVSFSDRTRRGQRFDLPSGQQLVVTWHQASNSPPNAADVRALKRALGQPHAPEPSALIPDPRHMTTATARGKLDRAAAVQSTPYQRFWPLLTARLRLERPAWRLGTPKGNDYPLISPLPGARIKCNFSRQGLRVELLLQSPDRGTNLRRLELLVSHLPELQSRFGPDPTLVAEPLPNRTQARVAAYRPGTIDQEPDWSSFLDWFQRVSTNLEHALRATSVVSVQWPMTTTGHGGH